MNGGTGGYGGSADYDHDAISIPFPERPWDLIHVTDSGGELWLGGHRCRGGDEMCRPDAQFDVVISLYVRDGFDPDAGVKHYTLTIPDGPLDPDKYEALDWLATSAVSATDEGKKVLIRCHAGINRSAMVMALALGQLGVAPRYAVEAMRSARSRHVLSNPYFLAHLDRRWAEKTTRGKASENGETP